MLGGGDVNYGYAPGNKRAMHDPSQFEIHRFLQSRLLSPRRTQGKNPRGRPSRVIALLPLHRRPIDYAALSRAQRKRTIRGQLDIDRFLQSRRSAPQRTLQNTWHSPTSARC
jgi:hypothetical protein